MSNFFEEGKFYKFASENAKNSLSPVDGQLITKLLDTSV